MKRNGISGETSKMLSRDGGRKKLPYSDLLATRVRQGENSGAAIRRRGAVIVFALVALLVASTMIASLLRTASISHRQLQRDEYRVQASLLADAGCTRAAIQLKSQPDFTDELWSVPGEQLGSGKAAAVQIRIAADPAKPDVRLLVVAAEYPKGHPDLVRVTRKLRVP